MAQFFQGLQARLGAIGILVARILLDQVLVGLRSVHVQRLALQALATQQRHLGVDERPRAAGAVDLRQLEHDPLAVATVVGTVGIVQVVVHRPAGTADGAGSQGKNDQGAHGDLL